VVKTRHMPVNTNRI